MYQGFTYFSKVQKDPQKWLQGHFMKEEYGSPQP